MKYIRTALLLAFVATVSILLLRSHCENLELRSEIAERTKTVESYECLVESRNETLAHSRFGTAVLCRMALSGTHSDVFNFLDKSPVGSLRCKMIDLSESPGTKLFWYAQMRESDDGTRLPLEEAKSVLFVVNTDSLAIVDYVMIKRFLGPLGNVDAPYQYRIDCNLPDGTPVKYKVLPTGFERIQ